MTTGYVPEEQRDTRWYIWEKLFQCRVPYLQSMSPEYIKHFGILVSGDPVRDKAVVAETIVTMIPIAKMVEYFAKGVTVGVVNHKDTAVIYEHITNHLNAWKHQLEFGLVNHDAPLEDLMLMDRFATAVHKHARHHFDNNYVESLLQRGLLSTMSINRISILKPAQPAVQTNSDGEEVPKFPERESLASSFAAKRSLVTGQPKWKI